MNKAIIIGNLTRDPEIKTLPSGSKVANISVATNETYKNKEGQVVNEPEYHTVTFFGKTADIIGKYFTKGQSIVVEGRIKTRSWDDPNTGEKKYRTEIIGASFHFNGKGNDGKKSESKNDSYDSIEQYQEQVMKEPEIQYPTDDINPDDIPF